ncbi:MAG: DUF6350 family protein [Actinomycetota bacterium]|nr:DUF6350 family protein [Actinomycetota bacterium]
MTSLLPSSRARTRTARADETLDDTEHHLGHRRPLVPLAFLGGVTAAASTLVVFLGLGVVGWFLTDGGVHGAPRDGLRIGALGWLLGHGSGVHVEGVAITAMPLGVTLVCAWAVWRIGKRVGDSISGHGPDAAGISDGERDWTVPLAAGLFALGYVVTAVLVASVAATPATSPSTPGVVGWSLALCLAVGAPAIAVGAGRAAIWLTPAPLPARSALTLARVILTAWLAVSMVALAAALVVDVDTAANIMSQLDADAGDTVVFVVLTLLVLPNAMAFSGSYLLGPGFTVGTGTLVTPQAAVLGALPMFPLLAALPDNGSAPSWAAWLVGLPVLVALLAALHVQRSFPTVRWDQGALRGCAGGILAAVGFTAVAAVAGGAVGPGRMHDVHPLVGDVLLQSVTAFGIGGLLGGLAMTWWQRRTTLETDEPGEPASS